MSRKRNGAGSIYKVGDYWRAKIQIGTNPVTGKAKYKSFSAKTKTEVTKKLNEYKKNAPVAIADTSAPAPELYLDEAITRWAIDVKKNTLKPESFSRLTSTINTHIIPKIGLIEVKDITVDTIQRNLINAMFNEKQSLSSIKKAYSAMNNYYKYWIKQELIAGRQHYNIMDLVELPSVHKFEAKEIKAMSDTEVQTFLNQLFIRDGFDEYRYKHCHIISLMLNTGMRLGEVCGLIADDYDRENKTLFIQRNVIETNDVTEEAGKLEKGRRQIVVQSSPKTSSGYRKIPLNEAAISDLEWLIKRNEQLADKTDFLAVSVSGELLWPSNIVKTINRIFKAVELDYSGAHVLRHTYATALFAQGIDLKTVSSLLGHANIGITSDTYIHFIESLKYSKEERVFKPFPENLLR